MTSDARVAIRAEHDILAARRAARQLATELGFSDLELTMIATAISEIARNTLTYAGSGEMSFERIHESGRIGLQIVAIDRGPGITDVESAMQDGFSTGRGLGLGLPGARRLMDAFDLTSVAGAGTTIKMIKWCPR